MSTDSWVRIQVENSVPVLIDGNNLLFAARAIEDPQRPMGRAALCQALGRWAEGRGERVTVVFDGAAPAAGLARQIAGERIEVLYSGLGVTADEVLTRLLETDSAARRLLVVSSDREVGKAARRRRARPLDSSGFWVMVRSDLARPPRKPLEPRAKRTGLDEHLTSEWLAELGLDEPDSSEERHPQDESLGDSN